MIRPARIDQPHRKFIEIIQRPGDRLVPKRASQSLSTWRAGDTAFAFRVQGPGDAKQFPPDRRSANDKSEHPPAPSKYCLPASAFPGLQIGSIHALAPAGFRDLALVCCVWMNAARLAIWSSVAIKRRHSLVGAPVAHHGANLVAVHISRPPAWSASGRARSLPRRHRARDKRRSVAEISVAPCSTNSAAYFDLVVAFLFGFTAGLRPELAGCCAVVFTTETYGHNAEQHSRDRGCAKRFSPTRFSRRTALTGATCRCGRACGAVLPSVIPSTHLIASKYILRMSGSLHDSCVWPSVE